MTATVTGRGTATRAPARARRPAARRGLAFPRASTTPGKVRLLRIGLVIACLGWGALAALMVEQHASAAHDVASVSEPLSLEARQMYQSLADADVTASTGYLYGRIQPFPGRQRYEHDIAAATADLKAVTAASRDSAGDADFQQDFRAAQGTFGSLLTRAGTAAGSGALTGLEAGVAVLALIMAIGSARGLSRRLAEYR
jgi:hypothetical protein